LIFWACSLNSGLQSLVSCHVKDTSAKYHRIWLAFLLINFTVHCNNLCVHEWQELGLPKLIIVVLFQTQYSTFHITFVGDLLKVFLGVCYTELCQKMDPKIRWTLPSAIFLLDVAFSAYLVSTVHIPSHAIRVQHV
jgi:hypothetical protein